MRIFSLFVLVTAAWAQGPQTMPQIEGESFAGRKVVLPDATKGHIAVLVFGFTKASKEPTSAWANRILADFGSQGEFEFYQLPVLEDVPRLIRGMVISSIRKGTKESMRDHFVPVLQKESELKNLVGYKEPDAAYLVILDRSGQIVRQMSGPCSETAYSQLQEEVRKLLGR